MPGRIVLLAPGGVEVDSWALPELTRVGLGEIDELARMLLAAKRLGLTLSLQDPCPGLLSLVRLVGLDELTVLGIEPVGQPEGGEDLRAEEVVVPDDPVA